MIIKVYQSKEDEYIGKSNPLEFINEKVYNCVGYDEESNMARLFDETGEEYLFY